MPHDKETDSAIPVLFNHCQEAYKAMFDKASKMTGDGGIEMLVYEGHLTKLITKQLNLSVPYYTSVTRELKRMGCIRQLRRGGGSAPSQWELLHEPTVELFMSEQSRRHRPDKHAQAQDQINNLATRVNKIEQALGIGE